MMFEIEQSWNNALKEEFKKPYFNALLNFLEEEYKNAKVFPPQKEVFNAFHFTPFDKVKVVIIGQDPYHDNHQAHGLCFSVNDGVASPPSLVNIFKELENDVDKSIPSSGNLSHWAKQGVLLLNATLTVRAHRAGSHQGKGWENFTDEVIRQLSAQKENLIFLLWVGYAKNKAKLIDADKHKILMSGHPSPLSANRGYWFENKHFSKTNQLLSDFGSSPIEW